MANGTDVEVTVAYATPAEQRVVRVLLPAGSTVEEAVNRSGLPDQFPEISRINCAVGIFGEVVPRERLVSDGDRIEIYRPLIADPKESRRKRGKKQR